MIFGVTGFNAAGKGEFCAYLAAKGFIVYSLSDIIREELTKEGKDIARENLISKGNELRSKHGSSILAKRTMQKLEPGKNYVIDSIRNPEEINLLKRNHDFKLVFIEAPLKQRYRRVVKRKREGEETLAFKEFQALEQKETASNNSANQQLLKCKEMADVVIVNDSTLKALHKKIDKLIGDSR
jgi:dephospho-CoA kinase